MPKYLRGQKRTEGKTKIIWGVQGNPHLAIVESKDDITAGDGAKHDLMSGKAAMANQTTCNVFRLLLAHTKHIPLTFLEQLDDRSFLAYYALMLPWEVVARRKAWGSYLKRYPDFEKGHRFNPPLVEFFLKTSGKKWMGYDLPEDDPFAIILSTGTIHLFNPKLPMAQQQPFLTLPRVEGSEYNQQMTKVTRDVFQAIEDAWKAFGGELIDFKIEFGLLDDGELVVADVIDNDSWRVLDESGENLDKQVYRDGAPLEDVTAKYRYVADITSKF